MLGVISVWHLKTSCGLCFFSSLVQQVGAGRSRRILTHRGWVSGKAVLGLKCISHKELLECQALNHFLCIYIILQIPVPVPNLHLEWREGLLEAPLRISQYKISFWEEAQLKPTYLMVLLRWMCCVCMWKKAVFQSKVCLGSGKHNCTFNTLPFCPLGLHSKCDQPWGGGKRC